MQTSEPVLLHGGGWFENGEVGARVGRGTKSQRQSGSGSDPEERKTSGRPRAYMRKEELGV